MPYHKIANASGMHLVHLTRNGPLEHDPISQATNGRITSEQIREIKRLDREQNG